VIEPFVLEILPARGLDQSMLLPVLIGLYIVLLSTELFGWVFAGAIVPGYLAAVLTIQPVTGVIVIFESLLTLLLSEALAKGLSKTDAWTRFFGRERFFLILMVSLIVRMHDHAWFAPWAIMQYDQLFGTHYESQQEFYSVGLVLVPLTANMLWKPQIHRGLMQLAVQVGLTFLLVKFVLLPYTNLSLSSVELTYENAAINFVGHAKAHIILLTAALLAAQFNLTYGWDFNGILVPALLAMLWLTPLKLVATIGEAIIVFYLTKGFRNLPVIKHFDFEGPRKIVLVFTLAFVWKLALGFTLAPIFPNLKISDTYGFGYLLSSLLAVKMIGVKSVRAVLLPSLTASAGGFVLGSAIGFMLDLAWPKPLPDRNIDRPASTRLVMTPLGVMTHARVNLELHRELLESPTRAESARLQEFWTAAAATRGDQADVGALEQLGYDLGLQVVELGSFVVGEGVESTAPGTVPQRREWLAIVADEGTRWRGFTTGLLSPAGEGPVLVVPVPTSEAPVAEVAAISCRRVDCRAVLVAGSESTRPGTLVDRSPVEIAMQAYGDEEIVVLRADLGRPAGGYVAQTITALESASVNPSELPELASPASASASAGVDVRTRVHQLRGRLETTQIWSEYDLDWEPIESIVAPPAGTGAFVVLRSTQAQFESFVQAHAGEFGAFDMSSSALAAGEVAVEADPSAPQRTSTAFDVQQLPSELVRIHELRETPGTWGKGYRAPSSVELEVLERLVVEPLMAWADTSTTGSPPAAVALRAAELDYELVEFGPCKKKPGELEACSGCKNGPCLVMLRERSRATTAGWGTLVVRRGGRAGTHVIEVPHPFRELETWRIGAELWALLEGRALLIAGADGLPLDPVAARDVEADEGLVLAPNPDPVRAGNVRTPFQAIHQALDRSAYPGGVAAASRSASDGSEASGAEGPPPVRVRFEAVQIRGLAAYRPIVRDVIVGMGLPEAGQLLDAACWSRLSLELAPLVARWNSCQIADGSEDLYLLTGAGTPQVEYSIQLGNAVVRVLWFSASLRERYAAPRTSTVADAGVVRGLQQAGFEVVPAREIQLMLAPLFGRETGLGGDGRPRVALGNDAFEAAVKAAIGYAETGNYHELRTIADIADTALDVRVKAAIGLDYGQPVLIIEYVGEAIGKRALVTLAHGLDGRATSHAEVLDDVLHVRMELLNRPQVLIITNKPIFAMPAMPGVAPASGASP
jgi:hypothetical protein